MEKLKKFRKKLKKDVGRWEKESFAFAHGSAQTLVKDAVEELDNEVDARKG